MTQPAYEPGGDIYREAVARRGGHEYAGGPVAWEYSEGQRPACPGCSLCTPQEHR